MHHGLPIRRRWDDIRRVAGKYLDPANLLDVIVQPAPRAAQ